MRRFSWVVPVLLVVSLLSGVRDARALPTSEIFDTYFDCQLNEVGFRILSCGGHVYTQGQQSGAYRLREWTHCDTGAYSYQWYAWNGSGWTAIAGPPQASC